MPLFTVSASKVALISQASLGSEKVLQNFVENNLGAIFNCRFVATEAVKPGAGSTVLAHALAFVLDRNTELAHIAA